MLCNGYCIVHYKRLRIQGFRSFKKECEFNFGNTPGLYNLCGNNLVEPSLGGNGAGKSSIADALVWVLYGKTASGAKASSLANWSTTEKVKVELDFDLLSKTYTLVRTWNPNKILLVTEGESRPVTQDELECLLKQNVESFLLTTLLSQNGQMFLDMKPADKLKVFSEALGLENWVTYSKEAKRRGTEAEKDLSHKQISLANAEGKLIALKQTDYTDDIKDWDVSEKEACEKLDRERATILDTISWTHADIEQHKTEVAALPEKQNSPTISEKYITRVSERKASIAQLHNSIREQKRAYKSLDTVETTCASCGREFDNAAEAVEHNKRDRAAILDKITELDRAVAAQNIRLDSSQRSLDKQKELISDIALEQGVIDENRTRAESALASASRKLEQLQKDLRRADEASSTRPENPYKKRQSDLIALIKKSESSVARIKLQEVSAQDTVDVYKYWVRGFKDVQLYLINSALAQLELEVNSALETLGLHEWKITFSVESETASNTISRGFKVFVQCPHKNEPVAWESWSGGEKQRLKLAASLGMINLLLSTKGLSSSIEIYDEPTTGLSKEGIEDMLDTLRSRAISQGSCIWVVDHHSLEFGGFFERVVVTKDSEGSHI